MIELVGSISPHYERVVELGDANRATLGLLPYEAIRQATDEGRVLACVDGGEVKGYALYGKRVRTSDISLTHLCVDRGYRGQGIARELVDGIVERNPHRAGIRLSCREDYEANAMWPKLGFQRLGERPGRSRAGHLLVTWWLPIAAQTLFDTPEQDNARMVVAVDTNVLLDILEERDFPASRALTADWVAATAELVMTQRSHYELSDQRIRNAGFKSALAEFRILEPFPEALREKLLALRGDPSASRMRDGDLQVIAQAAAGGAACLVSRDDDLLRNEKGLERLTGLSLTGPDDFLLRLQALGGEHNPQTLTIAASGLSVSAVSRMPANAELSVYRHKHIRERTADLKQRLSAAIAHPSRRVERLTTDSGEPLMLGAMYREGRQVTVTVLRGAAGQRSYTALRQMVHHLRGIAATQGPATVIVDDQTDESVDQALQDEGFITRGAAWKAVVDTGIFGPGDALPQELERIDWRGLNAHLVREYERYAWPSKVFSGEVASYVVPVKPEYARVILGYEEPQTRLIELNRRTAAARDNVYYMSPRRFVEAPARIIWWVSGGGSLGGVRAVSWLDEVDTGDPRRLYRKYRNRGVLEEQQVIRNAKTFQKSSRRVATALLFSQTETFPAPVPISRARELCDSMRKQGYFITTRKISEMTVRAFYEEGRRRHDQRKRTT